MSRFTDLTEKQQERWYAWIAERTKVRIDRTATYNHLKADLKAKLKVLGFGGGDPQLSPIKLYPERFEDAWAAEDWRAIDDIFDDVEIWAHMNAHWEQCRKEVAELGCG
jgi:hypothetical protein